MSFQRIPQDQRRPIFATEFTNLFAISGPGVKEYNVLVTGQKLTVGTKAALTKHIVTSADQAREYFGAGSMLAEMIVMFLSNSGTVRLTAIAMNDDGGGVAATGSQIFIGPCTKSGTLYFYLAGHGKSSVTGLRIKVAVTKDDSDEDVVAALVAAIADEPNRLINAAIDGVNAAKVNFTARHKGEESKDLDFRFGYFAGEAFPEGITLGATEVMSGGTGNPDISSVLAVMGDTQYDFIINPYNDAANLTALDVELEKRWGPLKQNDGRYIGAKRGDYTTISTLTSAQNSKHGSISTAEGPMPAYIWAASIAGQVVESIKNDPARPMQTLELIGIMPPADNEQLSEVERELLLKDGASTNVTAAGGKVRIEMMITLYQVNDFGADDESYLYLNTPCTLSYLRYDWNTSVAQKYGRHKLANDGGKIAPGQPIVTPRLMRAHAVSKAVQWETAGLIESADAFAAALIVERPQHSVVTLDLIMRPDLVNQLRIVRNLMAYIL